MWSRRMHLTSLTFLVALILWLFQSWRISVRLTLLRFSTADRANGYGEEPSGLLPCTFSAQPGIRSFAVANTVTVWVTL